MIRRPLHPDSSCNVLAPSGTLLEEEAPLYIAPSKTLKSHERINLYNQQYYWRLLNALQENFPLLLRLFGYDDFNNLLGMPYLSKSKIKSWSLANFGIDFPAYLAKEYHEPDKEIVLDAAELDAAYTFGFTAPLLPLPDASVTEETLLTLQPHLFLKCYPYALLAFRDQMIKEKVEHWIDNPFPELKREKCNILLFRNHFNNLEWRELSDEEFNLLFSFKEGASLSTALSGKNESLTGEIEKLFFSFGALKLFGIKPRAL